MGVTGCCGSTSQYHNDAPVIRSCSGVRAGPAPLRQGREIPRIKMARDGDPLDTAGLMTDREARNPRIGGELLAVVW